MKVLEVARKQPNVAIRRLGAAHDESGIPNKIY